MKTILLTVLFALHVHAEDVVFMTNEYSKEYETVNNLRLHDNDLSAIKKLKVLFTLDRQNEGYILGELSKLYIKQKLNDSFISFLETQLVKAPFSTDLNYQLAKEYLASNKTDEACNKAKFIIPHAPKRIVFYSILADCALASNQLAEALRYLDMQITSQSDPNLFLKRAQLYLKLNKLPQAKSDLDIYFLKAKPGEQGFLLQSELYAKQQLEEKIPGVYQTCLKTIGASVKCFSGYLAATKDLNTKFKIEHFNDYLNTYKRNPEILLEIGYYYQKLKNYELAEIMYLSAHKITPEKIEPVTSLFQLYNEQSESQKAFDIVNKFFTYSRNTADLHTAQNLQNSLFKKTLDEPSAQPVAPASSQQPPAFTNSSYRKLFLAKKYTELLAKMQKIPKKSDAEYFLMGNLHYHTGSFGNAKFYWSKVKPASNLYYKSVFNTTVIMRVENMRTSAQKLFSSTEFPLSMYAQTQKLAALMSEYSTRLPAEEKKKITEMLTALLYLEWES